MSTGSRSRTASPLRRLATVVVVLGAATAAACGSDEVRTDGAPSPTTMSMDRWRSSMEDVCDELDERFDELPDAELRNAEDAVEHADAVEDYADRLASAASGLTEQSVERPAIAEFEASAVELADAAGALARATREGDAAAAADAVEAVDAAGAEINELAAELSLDGCDGF